MAEVVRTHFTLKIVNHFLKSCVAIVAGTTQWHISVLGSSIIERLCPEEIR